MLFLYNNDLVTQAICVTPYQKLGMIQICCTTTEKRTKKRCFMLFRCLHYSYISTLVYKTTNNLETYVWTQVVFT